MIFGPAGHRRFSGSGRPRGPPTPPKIWGASPPIFLNGFPGPRGRPDPEHRRFPAGPNIMYSKPKCKYGKGLIATWVVACCMAGRAGCLRPGCARHGCPLGGAFRILSAAVFVPVRALLTSVVCCFGPFCGRGWPQDLVERVGL